MLLGILLRREKREKWLQLSKILYFGTVLHCKLYRLQFKYNNQGADSEAFIFRIARYLEPLAIAANIVQDSFCRLDQVLLTFGFLLMQYRDENMKEDPVGRDSIIASIEARWAKADQQVFVCAVLVNPFYRTIPFASLPCFNQAHIRVLLTQLYIRFYGEPVDDLFMTHAYDFFNGTGFFKHIDGQIDFEIKEATREVIFYFLLQAGPIN